jgi:ribosomal-protein-alanine N-acetyltransferase
MVTMESLAGNVQNGRAVIELANWKDLNVLRQLEKACFPKDAWPLWDMIGILTLPGVVRLKAVVGEQMVGFVGVDIRQSERLAWIATIGVLPEYRRQGIGGALLLACERELEARQQQARVSAIRLTVRKSNLAAIRLYEELGYHKVGLWPSYYQDKEDGVVMEKAL